MWRLAVLFMSCSYLVGSLAFPWGPSFLSRGGRSVDSPKCCPYGVKSEVREDERHEEFVRNACPEHLSCCAGLREVMHLKGNGEPYTLCIPDEEEDYMSQKELEELGRYLDFRP